MEHDFLAFLQLSPVATLRHRLLRPFHARRASRLAPLRIYYGCGLTRQPGYLNVDVRWTPAVDLLADLEWCARRFAGQCSEIFMSHVIEHYRSPGKGLRRTPETAIGALVAAARALRPGGIVRIAVPDFEALARLYTNGTLPLFPRLLGRLCGAQNYRENVHRCAFDREFLELCLREAGFERFETWNPTALNLAMDASFDELNGVRTSLNLLGHKPGDGGSLPAREPH